MTLAERTRRFMEATPINVSEFCRRISISRTSLYDFLRGDLRLCDATQQRISEYLDKFNF